MTIQFERSVTRDDLTALLDRRTPGYSLEAPFYTSPEVFDLDMSAIFAGHWIFVATEAELPEPGDFVTVEVGRYSVIIVRDDDEAVRAFRNVCRHRGSRILDEERGSVGNLVCPYHHWTYGVDGCLLHAENQPRHVRPQPLRAQARPRPQRRRPRVRLPRRRAPGRLRRGRGAHRALPGALRPAADEDRPPGRHRRGRQLEARHGEQPRVLPLRRPPRTGERLLPAARLHARRRPAPAAPGLGPLREGTQRPAGGLRAAGLPGRGHARARHTPHRVHGLPRSARRRREVVQRGR